MRYILSVLLLLAMLPVASAQDKEAEKLFRDLEKKIKAANAVQIVADIELREIDGDNTKSVSGAGAFLLMTKDNKARLKISGENVGMEMVSNGKGMKHVTDGEEGRSIDDQPKAGPAPSKFHGVLSTFVSRGGVELTAMTMTLLAALGDREFDPDGEDSAFAAWDFKVGAAEKVRTRDATVIRYKFGNKNDDRADTFTLWLDSKSLLPLKKAYTIRSQNRHITEVYTEFNLDPKIDAKAFDLIPTPGNDAEKLFRAMEDKIKAAKAVQYTFDIEMKAKVKGKDRVANSKGTLLFTRNNRARLMASTNETGEDVTVEMISDGERLKMAESPDTIAKAEEEKTRPNLHSLLTKMVSGPGVWLSQDALKDPAPPMFRLVYFKAGAAEKIGGRDTKVISYNVTGQGGTERVTLWIDAETMLPVKRLVPFEGGGAGRFTEICTFNLNPKVDVKAFTLPK